MPETIFSALAQIPFVLAMLYAMLHFLAHLEKRDEDWQRFIEQHDDRHGQEHQKIVEAIERLSQQMQECAHR